MKRKRHNGRKQEEKKSEESFFLKHFQVIHKHLIGNMMMGDKVSKQFPEWAWRVKFDNLYKFNKLAAHLPAARGLCAYLRCTVPWACNLKDKHGSIFS